MCLNSGVDFHKPSTLCLFSYLSAVSQLLSVPRSRVYGLSQFFYSSTCDMGHTPIYRWQSLISNINLFQTTEIFKFVSSNYFILLLYHINFILSTIFFKNIFYFHFIIHILFCQEKNFIFLFSLYSIILNLWTRCFWLNLTQNIFLLTNLFIYSIIYYGESVFFDKNNKLIKTI